MKQWDIWTCDFAGAGPHPAVVVSHPDRVARAPLVNVLIASSQRASRPARENEVLLNGADGLDWEDAGEVRPDVSGGERAAVSAPGQCRYCAASRVCPTHQCLFRVHLGLMGG